MMKPNGLTLLLSLTALASAACSEGTTVLAESTTVTIPISGGTALSADGDLTITFEPGAVSAPTEVTIVTDRSATTEGLRSPVYEVQPRGLQFERPVHLSFDLAGYEAEDVTLAFVEASGTTPVPGCAPSESGGVECESVQDPRSRLAVLASTPPTVVDKVFAGGYWGCVQFQTGNIHCWGAISNDDPTSVDYRPHPLGPFVELNKGHYHHTCAQYASGEVECFGLLDFGQVPPAGTRFRAFSSGGFHNCGILLDGTLQCWGHSGYGQLLAPAGQFDAVSAGITRSCALRDDGDVVCWGGSESTTVHSGPYVAVSVGGGACAQRPDQTLDCWFGLNPPSGAFENFSVGTNHACGVRIDGTSLCWGAEVGYGETNVPAGVAFTQLSAGGAFSCGLRTDGQVQCWGLGRLGQTNPPTF